MERGTDGNELLIAANFEIPETTGNGDSTDAFDTSNSFGSFNHSAESDMFSQSCPVSNPYDFDSRVAGA